MKLVVDRKKLKAILSATRSCLPVKPQSEYEANPSFRVSSGVLVVSSTDFSQGLELSCPVDGDGDFAVSFDIKKLEKIVAKTDTGSVEIEYVQEKGSVRVSASDEKKGFVELPAIPYAKVPVFDAEALSGTPVCTLPGSVLKEGVDFASTYLPAILERNPKYDFVQVRNGLVYAANGANRRGFFASPSISATTEVKILKKFALCLPKALTAFPTDASAEIFESSRTYTIRSTDGVFTYRCIKARTEPSEIPMEYLIPKGSHTVVDVTKLARLMEKVVIPEYQSAGVAIGVRLVMRPPEDIVTGSSSVDLSLVTAKRQEAQESLACLRLGETAESREVDKVVDFKMFKDMVSSLPTGGSDTKVFMNDPDSKFFKMQRILEVGGHKCVALAVGAYARIAKV